MSRDGKFHWDDYIQAKSKKDKEKLREIGNTGYKKGEEEGLEHQRVEILIERL